MRRRTFVMDQSGAILFTEGTVARYDGTFLSPHGAAALSMSGSMIDGLADGIGWDGNTWAPRGSLPLY